MATNPNEAGGWVIDPKNPNRATYTDPNGEVHEIFKKAPTAVNEQGGVIPVDTTNVTNASRGDTSMLGRFKDAFGEAAQSGFPGLVARKYYDWTNYGVDQLKQMYPGRSDEWYEDQADKTIAAAQANLRDQYAKEFEQDPSWDSNKSWLENIANVKQWAPSVAGQVAGAGGPEMFLNPGRNAAARIAAQGGLSGLSDAGYQLMDIADKVKKEFSTNEMLGAAAAGAGFQSAFEVPSFVRDLFKNRGLDTTPGESPIGKGDIINPADDRLSPDDEQMLQTLYKTGSYDQIMDFFSQRPHFKVDPAQVKAWTDLTPEQRAHVSGIPYLDQNAKPTLEEANPQPQPIPDANGQYSLDLNPQETQGNLPLEDPIQPAQQRAMDARDHVKDLVDQVGTEARDNHAEAAADLINQVAKGWKNPPQMEVYNSFKDIPRDISDELDPSMIGVTMPDGKVLINLEGVSAHAKAIGSTEREVLSAVTYHEGLGHHGLSQQFGNQLDSTLENLYANNKKFAEQVDEWNEKNPGAYDHAENPLARQAEEVFADASENGRISLNAKEKVKGTIQKYARQMGLTRKIGDDEVRAILSTAHDATIDGTAPSLRGSMVADDDADARYSRREKSQQATAILNQGEVGKTHVVRPFPEEEPDYHRFQYRGEDGEVVGGNYHISDDGKTIEDFSIHSSTGKNNIGTSRIRQIARDLRDQHPGVENLEGMRISGARKGTPNQDTYVTTQLNRYMKRYEAGSGSVNEKTQGGSEREGSKLGVGTFRSSRDLDDILGEAKSKDTRQEWNDWIDEANQLRTIARKAKELKTGSTPAEVLNAREAIIREANKVKDLVEKATNGELTERQEMNLIAHQARLADMMDALDGVRSNAARVVNSFRIGVATDEAFRSNFRHMLDNTNNELFKDPVYRRQFFQQLRSFANNPTAVRRMVRAAFKPKAEDFMFRVWYNMLLSSPATHAYNFLGTGANFGIDLLEKTGASILGQGKRFSNRERIQGREIMYRMFGALSALRDSNTYANVRRSLTTGHPSDGQTRSTHVYTGTNPVAGAASGFLEAPTRALAGGDEFWRNVLHLSHLYGLAARNAGNQGLTGAAYRRELNNLINNPTTEMLESAGNYTRTLQFLDRPSAVAQSIITLQTPRATDHIGARVARAGLRFALPFVRTPDSLIRTSLRRTPLGVFERENVNGWRRGGADRDQVKARLIMGSLFAGWVGMMASKGLITGEGPSDYRKNAEWSTNHQKNSIKVGDTWYSIQGLDPVTTNLTGIASLVEQYKEGELNHNSVMDQALNLAHATAGIIANNSWLESLQNLLDFNNDDPQKSKSAVTNFLAGLVSNATTPAIERQYTQSTDTAVRDSTGDKSTTDRIEGRVKSGQPTESTELPQKYDVFGRPLNRDRAGLDMFSRVDTQTDDASPGIKEAQRLAEGTNSILVGPPKSSFKKNGVQQKMNAEEYQRYQHLSGYWISKIMDEQVKDKDYQNMSDDEKRETLKEVVAFARGEARDYLFKSADDE